MTCYINSATIAIGNYKLTVSHKLCLSLMCIFFVDWAAHHPEEISFSNPQLNDEITLSVFSQCIRVASGMPKPNIDICRLHYFLSPLLHIHIRQTAIVKCNISLSCALCDGVSFHSRVRCHPYWPIKKQNHFIWNLNCCFHSNNFSNVALFSSTRVA